MILAERAADKEAWRERIWEEMHSARVEVFPGARGRIPNFIGAETAAQRLAETDAWRACFVLCVGPDAAQKEVRLRALREGKLLIVPSPRLDEVRCLRRLDPEEIPGEHLARAATLRGSRRFGRKIAPRDVPLLDLLVSGSVAANAMGQRVGKGCGLTDLVYALGREHRFVLEDTVVATTVHESQLVDDPLPVTAHDVDLDLVVTPRAVVRTVRGRPRPPGVLWEHLTPETLRTIPVLGRLRRGHGRL